MAGGRVGPERVGGEFLGAREAATAERALIPWDVRLGVRREALFGPNLSVGRLYVLDQFGGGRYVGAAVGTDFCHGFTFGLLSPTSGAMGFVVVSRCRSLTGDCRASRA
jgi:hypothetical protein